ncbi:Clr6 histone deacetylase complex subunit Sds3 [Schizosaccharomyces cryophilus OY26]|uniref:Clr6 histone deacetylase complex subunit Sds3 n=1 Tax=Schizosaccharomyces cryophilus (strain OY26 / ATCC MYA-4695 / CBS 11777 / NBRC 106824 / NRRL Y48691) TaxID=653667 RepID=S9VUG6_SCHCR|nr:Clr6 histone deacetylase complex subunit Sds3 [Schizosaccharomyces cryophilus OY26]EPY51423.1 Clr6 histone deacetylase complex subunit Sds3 [Schizosaccharomyces cryophilus OY26]
MDVLSRVLDMKNEDDDEFLDMPLTASEFEAKKQELQEELTAIRNGTCRTLLDLFHGLQEKKEEELEIEEQWRRHLMERAQEEYEAELKDAREEYEQRCNSLQAMVLSHLAEKKRHIMEAKDMFDIANESSSLLLHDASSQFIDRRKLRHRRNASSNNSTSNQLPTLNFFDDYLLFPTEETAEIPESIKKTVRNSVNSARPSNVELSLFSPLLTMANVNISAARDRDFRAMERAERDREKAVDKGLTGASEEDVKHDLQLLKKEILKKR